MAKFKVVLDRLSCIGAGACDDDEKWKLNDDGKVDLIGSSEKEGKQFELEIDEKDLDMFIASAQSCPVNAIHVYDENGDKLV